MSSPHKDKDYIEVLMLRHNNKEMIHESVILYHVPGKSFKISNSLQTKKIMIVSKNV